MAVEEIDCTFTIFVSGFAPPVSPTGLLLNYPRSSVLSLCFTVPSITLEWIDSVIGQCSSPRTIPAQFSTTFVYDNPASVYSRDRAFVPINSITRMESNI